MIKVIKLKRVAAVCIAAVLTISCAAAVSSERARTVSGEYIKWVDFTPTTSALRQALEIDIKSHDSDTPVGWIELLAYAACKNGGKFAGGKDKYITQLYERIQNAEDIEVITSDMKYYSYFYEAYSAVLSGYVGYNEDGEYGVLVRSPFAAGYYYSHFDDFGVARSYGYKRKHLGHDMMGSVGTPIMAVEGGRIEALGWNQYGGWRVGIRSDDGRRYYYYAHLRKDKPFAEGLREGDTVKAGQLIGYLGMTGYSSKENVNNINTPHLHFGIQLIFDESQKDGVNQIWIDCYQIINFLEKYRAKV
ncbi:MAG: M23 family metallopeptidase [Clostridia bacterium]|nr:M23 family metallopeptidase [Clostridia bacterium]